MLAEVEVFVLISCVILVGNATCELLFILRIVDDVPLVAAALRLKLLHHCFVLLKTGLLGKLFLVHLLFDDEIRVLVRRLARYIDRSDRCGAGLLERICHSPARFGVTVGQRESRLDLRPSDGFAQLKGLWNFDRLDLVLGCRPNSGFHGGNFRLHRL